MVELADRFTSVVSVVLALYQVAGVIGGVDRPRALAVAFDVHCAISHSGICTGFTVNDLPVGTSWCDRRQ